MSGATILRMRLRHLRDFLDRGVDLASARPRLDRRGFLWAGPSNPARKVVALSFDDGPSMDNTPDLLDLLHQNDARATFFVVGNRIPGCEPVLQRIVDEGHEVGNHTYNHPRTVHLGDAELRAEIERTNTLIASLTSVSPQLVRPPFGKDRRRFAQVSKDLGLKTVMWSIDSRDARGCSREQIARTVLENANSGAIVLLHDGGDRRSETLSATADILPELRTRGFECVTVSELIGASADGSPYAVSGFLHITLTLLERSSFGL